MGSTNWGRFTSSSRLIRIERAQVLTPRRRQTVSGVDMQKAFALLVVDDDVDFLAAIRTALSRVKGLQLLTAATAEGAARLLPEADAVLADCIFPYASEFEAMVRQSGKPLARMSGKVDRATNLELKKPFSKQDLLRTVEYLRFLYVPRAGQFRSATT